MGHKFDNKDYMTYFTCAPTLAMMRAPPPPPPEPRHRAHLMRSVVLPRRLVYNMCTQKPPHNYSEQLYTRYKKAISDYLNEKVLPSVREKTGQYMLKEVGKRWSHHKINVKWMRNFFSYLVRGTPVASVDCESAAVRTRAR
jgi:hypothetical protein